MQPARIENHTHELSPPTDWDAEANGHCGTLYVRAEVINGVNYMRSAWDAEALEGLKLAAGARLVIGIGGVIHPVVHMTHSALPDDFEPTYLCRSVLNDEAKPAARVDAVYPFGKEGLHVRSVIELDGMTFPEAARLAMEAADTLARDILDGTKEL